MTLITQISTSELSLIFLMTRTLNLNFVDIVGIRMEPLVHVPNMTIRKSIEGGHTGTMRCFSP